MSLSKPLPCQVRSTSGATWHPRWAMEHLGSLMKRLSFLVWVSACLVWSLSCRVWESSVIIGYGIQVPCRRVLETARAVVARDEERGVATNDPVVERLAKASPHHSVSGTACSLLEIFKMYTSNLYIVYEPIWFLNGSLY